jgi:hypothetical protein
MMMYINAKNPELTRNIWLEMTTGRLIAMPLILSMIFFAVFSLGSSINQTMDIVRVISILLFMVLGVLYGTKLATESIVGEMNDKTWDNQRLTLISPPAMVTGKLFGSTAFAWYGAVLALLMFMISSFYTEDPWLHIRFGIWLLLFTVLTHELALLASLLGIRKNRERQKLSWFFYYLVAVGVSYYIQGMVYLIFFTSALTKIKDQLFSLSWYFINFNIIDFLILSTLAFIFWAFTGLKNLVKSEFHFRNSSSTWIWFLIFVAIYCFGFGISFDFSFFGEAMFGEMKSVGLSFNIFLGVFLAYFINEMFIYYLMFNEKNNSLVLYRMIALLKNRNFKELTYASPLWLTSLAFGFILMLVFQVASISFFSNDFNLLSTDSFEMMWVLLPVNLFLYLLRDLFLLLFFNMNSSFKKPEIATLITLFIMYYIMPIISFFTVEHSANTYFSPFGTGLSSLVSILVQLTIIFILLLNQYKKSVKMLIVD